MVEWSKLAPDLKMLVTVYRENQSGAAVWMSRLAELLDGHCTKLELSKAEDKLNDLGLIDGKYEKVGRLWTHCYKVSSDAENFVKNISNNLTGYPREG